VVSNQKVTRKKRSAIKPLKVKLFALAREVSGGKREIELEFERKSVKITDIKERILQVYPQLKRIPFVLAVNYKIVAERQPNDNHVNHVNPPNTYTTEITAEDEIALLPPISGG
jgi:molybdopterin converting factor small subunit